MKSLFQIALILFSIVGLISCVKEKKELPPCIQSSLDNNKLISTDWTNSTVFISTNFGRYFYQIDSMSMIKTGDVSHNIFVKGDSFSLRVNSYFNCNGIELPLVRMTYTKMNDTLFNPYSYIGGTYFLTDYFEVSGGFYFPPPPSPVIDTTKEFVRNFIVSFRK